MLNFSSNLWNLLSLIINFLNYSDIMGMVVSRSKAETKNFNGKQTSLMDITLEDLKYFFSFLNLFIFFLNLNFSLHVFLILIPVMLIFSGQIIICTLWNKYADDLSDFLDKVEERPFVAIIQFCRPNIYRGELHISFIWQIYHLLL